MNLSNVADRVIDAINPPTLVQILRSTGYTTNADGQQVPTYTTLDSVRLQVQELTQSDLRKLDGMNIGGQRSKLYFSGNIASVVRADQKGGDLAKFNGQTWLCVAVLEQWNDWVAVAIVRQKEPA